MAADSFFGDPVSSAGAGGTLLSFIARSSPDISFPSSNCRLRFRWIRPVMICERYAAWGAPASVNSGAPAPAPVNPVAPAPLNCGAGYVALVQRSKLDPYPRLLVLPGTDNAIAGLACVPLAVVKSSSPPLIILAVVKQQAMWLVLTREFAVPHS